MALSVFGGCTVFGNYTTSQVLAMNALDIRKVRDVNLCRAHYEARTSEVVTSEMRRRHLDCRATIIQSDGYDPGPERRVQQQVPPRVVKRAVAETEVVPPRPAEAPSAPAFTATLPAPTPAIATTPPPVASSAAAGRPPIGNGRKPDGLTAHNCVVERRAGSSDSFARNACRHSVEAKGTCLPSPYANEDEPFPGTYTLDSWLFTLRGGEERREPKGAACVKRGGRVLYIACQAGIPYFTAADASRYGCFK